MNFWRQIGVVCLLAVATSPAAAQTRKPVVAVVEIRDSTGNDQSEKMQTMIETAIGMTGKFRLMERNQVGALVAEQARAQSGLVTTNTPGRKGGFEGVDYLIYGSITTLGATEKSNFGASLLAGMMSNRSQDCSNFDTKLGLDFKITDADSGEIRYQSHIDELQKSVTVCDHRNRVDFDGLLRSAGNRIAASLVTTIYPIQVAGVQQDGQIVLNYGDGVVAVGDILTLFARGDAIRDPSTNEVISYNETKLGMVQIAEVDGRISRAVPVTVFDAQPAIGTTARASTPSEIATLPKRKKK